MEALVIGCGKIGAGYDFNNDQILTHTKALSLRNDVQLSVYDIDKKKTDKVARRYHAHQCDKLSPLMYRPLNS